MLFRCRVCAEKDQRISDLKEQVAFLKSQLVVSNDPEHAPIGQYEADGILSAQQHVIEVPTPEQFSEDRQAEAERSERERLLAGTY